MTDAEIDRDLARKITRYVLARRLAVVAALLLGALIVFLQLRVTLQAGETVERIRDTQKVSSSNVATIKDLAQRIKSCTTPGEPCSERGQRQTARAVGDINKVVVLAAACADQPNVQTRTEIQACIVRALTKGQP